MDTSTAFPLSHDDSGSFDPLSWPRVLLCSIEVIIIVFSTGATDEDED